MILSAYHKLRPYLWHVTTRDNWISIRKRAGEGDYTLLSTAALHAEAKSPDFDLAQPREAAHALTLPWGTAHVSDQERLVNTEERLSFPEDWDLGRYCSWLNDFVFFWPGTADAPAMPHGKKHFRYCLRKSEVPLTFVRLKAEAVLDRLGSAALFSATATGAPAGRKKVVERSPDAFAAASTIGVPSSVVEVAFRDGLELRPREVTPVSQSRMQEVLGIDD